MKKILILGKGGTGRELFSWLSGEHPVAGYLDDQKQDADILAEIASWQTYQENYEFAAAIGSYKTMQNRWSILRDISIELFPPLVPASCNIESKYKKHGLIIFPGTHLTCDLEIGMHVFIYHNCVVSHDTSIGNYTMLANSVTVSGNCTIGERVYIGAGVTINEGLTIGDDSIIASGATVIGDVPANSIYISKKELRENRYL
ncbi:MAG: acetyltransferase [Gammaproteobacteria bacterium]|nr:acetyltransferase [Gammaproteobacteria bacterium]